MSKDFPSSHGSPPYPPTDDHVMEPSASGVFCSRILNMVNSEDVNAIILAQRHMWCCPRTKNQFITDKKKNVLLKGRTGSPRKLDRFEKTNEMLLNFNSLSNTRLQQMNDRFINHTRTLVEMKKDLDIIFRRIRMLKGKLAKQYPESFNSVHESPILEDDDDFDPTPKSAATTIATSEQSTESCDTSPSIISPTMSQDFEDLSQAPSETPSANGQLLTDDEVAHED